jgi:hypothetical protein
MKNEKMPIARLGAGALLLLAGTAFAQLRTTAPLVPEDSETRPRPSEEIQKLIRARLAEALPAWDKSVLTGYETPVAWEDNLNHRHLNTLLDETPFDWEGRLTPPPEADRLVDAGKSMRIRRAEGAFQYHSRRRVFGPELAGKAVPSESKVTGHLGSLLDKLAFPLAEGAKPEVQVQEVAIGADSAVTERYQAYAFFLLGRSIGGLPVEGSTVRAAVNARGEIQRLKIRWPHFRVREGASLLPRERVIEEAAQKVFAQTPTEKLQLASRLVYARTDRGEYLPAVQVDVTDGETPYRLTVPVAK